MPPVLETARLILQPLELADAGATQELFPHWDIVKFLAARVPWPYPADGAISYYRDVALPAIERGEEWHWTLRLKSAPKELIGSICLMKGDANNRGFWMGLPWHGKGLMTEATEVVTDYWFDVLGQQVLRVPKAVGNQTSRRISEKNGMRLVGYGEGNYVVGPMACEIWEVTTEEWSRKRRPYPKRSVESGGGLGSGT